MAGPLEQPDPLRLRISDDDRHQVAELLRDAAGAGRLELDELDERLEAAYAAKIYADLIPITADLPAAPPGTSPAPPSAPSRSVTSATEGYESSFAMMGECKRLGPWLVPERHTAFAMLGSVTLDLRQASFAAPETTISITAVMAGVEVIVDAYTRVIVEGVGIMGSFSEARARVDAELGADSPVVRLKGLALMSGVEIKRKPPAGEKIRRLLGR